MDIWNNLERVSLDDILDHSQALEQSTICEDDYERKCAHFGMLPEESEREHGSPLDF